MGTVAGCVEAIKRESERLVSLRRDLHAHPETSFQEHRTSKTIADTLSGWGIAVHRGLGGTGVVGTIRKGRSDRAIALRADMDALPMTERNSFPHASTHAGAMHACGHDGHMAMLLAAARGLLELEFDGIVHLIFQPAEEGGHGGAKAMIKDGLFEQFPVQAIFGMHNWPGLPAGEFAVRSGAVFASSNEFNITIHGQGTHAALPHGGIDPVPVACQVVQAFQTILTRNKAPLDAAVISVTTIRAGEAVNVIPDSCLLRGTVRTFSMEVLDMIEQRMRRIAEGTAQAFGARCEFQFARKYPPTVNHERESAFVREALRDVIGPERVREFEPTMTAEDFSFYLLEKAGCYFLIGNGDGAHRAAGHGPGSCNLHSPSYDFNDELIALGGSAWVGLVDAWFNGSRR